VKQGFGTYAEVESMDRFDRLALFYASMEQDGMVIDWTTGEITRPAPRTLRQP
jgi:hypothetical protein